MEKIHKIDCKIIVPNEDGGKLLTVVFKTIFNK